MTRQQIWVLWALLAMACYATNNFLVAAIATLALSKSDATVSCAFIIWIASGACGFVYLAYNRGVDIQRGHAITSISAATFSAAGTLVLSLALANDAADAGPITAVLPLNAFLVCALAYVMLGEKLRCMHWVGVAIAAAGPMLMALGSHSSHAYLGLMFGGCAAACFGVSNFLLKKASTQDAETTAVVTVLVCTMGCFGVLAVLVLYLCGRGLRGLVGDPHAGTLVIYAVGSGILWAVAKVFFQRSLAGGGPAGPASAIVNTNSVGVLLLSLIFLHPEVGVLKLVGMILCIIGTIILSATPPVKVASSQPARDEGAVSLTPMSNDP